MPPKPNPFICFCKEWKSKYGKRMTMQEAVEEAGKIWKDMDSNARAPYMDKARALRQSSSKKEPIKYTCTGRTLDEVEKEKNDAESKGRQMKRSIESLVRKSVKDNTLLSQKYYFIKVNYFVKTMNNCYVPAEVAVSEFNIKNGIQRTYHTMINPGKDLYGHHYNALSYTEETHKLPLPPKALGNKNLGEVFNNILQFVYDEDTESYPPIYTIRGDMPIVEAVLNFLQADPNARDAELNVYSLQYLLFILQDVACEINDAEKLGSYHIIDAYIENDYFEYQGGIACDYHEENDTTKFCALSCVVRWAYMFCDLLCKHLAVDLIAGRHCPVKAQLNAIIVDPNKTQSSKHSDIRMEKYRQRGGNNNFESASNTSDISYENVASGSSYVTEEKFAKQKKDEINKKYYNYENFPKLSKAFQRHQRPYYDTKEDDIQSQSSSHSNTFRPKDFPFKTADSPSAPSTYAYNDSDDNTDEYITSRIKGPHKYNNIPPTPDDSYFEFDNNTIKNELLGRGSRNPRRDRDESPLCGMGRGGAIS